MSSRISSVFAKAAEVLHKHYGELDDTGEVLDEQAVTLVIGEQPHEFPAVIGVLKFGMVQSSRGDWIRQATREVRIQRALVDAAGITDLPGRCHLQINDDEWAISMEDGTEFTAMFLVLKVRRDITTNIRAQERNG